MNVVQFLILFFLVVLCIVATDRQELIECLPVFHNETHFIMRVPFDFLGSIDPVVDASAFNIRYIELHEVEE